MNRAQFSTMFGALSMVLIFPVIFGCNSKMMPAREVLDKVGKAAGPFGCTGCELEEPSSLGEIAQDLLQHYGAADTNSDGLLSLEEAQSVSVVLAQQDFTEIDSNGDGFLSRIELCALPEVECIEGEAVIEGESVVEGEITAEGEAVIEGEIVIEGEVIVEGEIVIEGEVIVEGESVIEGEAVVEGESVIEGEAVVEGESVIEGEMVVEGESVFEGEGESEGEVVVEGEYEGEAPEVLEIICQDVELDLGDGGVATIIESETFYTTRSISIIYDSQYDWETNPADYGISAYPQFFSCEDLAGDPVEVTIRVENSAGLVAECVSRVTISDPLMFCTAGEGESMEGEPQVGPEQLVDVPSGTFQMGNPDVLGEWVNQRPVHEVYLDSYKIGKYEVTNQKYAEVLNWAHGRDYLTNYSGGAYTGGSIYACGQIIVGQPNQLTYSEGVFGVSNCVGHGDQVFSMADHPMIAVSWYGAVCYCNWLSEMRGLQACYDTSTWTRYEPVRNGYRLPTEAEWERAAAWESAGDGKHWIYGIYGLTGLLSINQANFYADAHVNPLGLKSFPYTTPVGWYNGQHPVWLIEPYVYTVRAVSPVGAYDMSGNVWEWCHDYYSYYTTATETNPTGPESGDYRVLRGGSWCDSEGAARSAYRLFFPPDFNRDIAGFRVACTPH